MNPPDVRDRMDEYIADVNAYLYVKDNTNRKGLKFKLLRNQVDPHIHQAEWRKVVRALESLKPSPLILVGHSFGGRRREYARSLESRGTTVDLLCTHDSIQTIDDLGDPNGAGERAAQPQPLCDPHASLDARAVSDRPAQLS